MKRQDLTSQVFGDLKVIQYSHNDPKSRSPMWLCSCTCGNSVTLRTHALTSGNNTSCGCKHAEKRDQGAREHIEKDKVDGTRKTSLKSKLHKGNKSGHKGVMWVESRKQWMAYIGFQGKNINLGYRANKEEAIALRLAAEEKYHKPYLEETNDD